MIEVEVWNSGKTTRQGKFITDVINVRTSERPNSASVYTFDIPAEGDDAFFTNGGECYIYVWQRGARMCIGGGEILQTTRVEVGDGGVNLRVEGLGLINELNYEYIPSLEVKATKTGSVPVYVEHNDGATATHLPNLYDQNTGTSSTFNLSTTEFIYVRAGAPFWELDVTLASAYENTQTSVVASDFQYYDGADWVSVSGYSDLTANAGRTFYQSETISWTEPGDWIQIIHNSVQGYWGRLHLASAPALTNVDFAELTVTTYGPDTSDLASIHTTAGYDGGLSLQAAGGGYYTSTTNGYYGAFNNMSALAAYRQLADFDSGIFRISAHDTRTVQYLRDQGFDTNYYAVGPASPSLYANLPSDTMLITGIDYEKDTRNEINRLYAYGSGNGAGDRIDLTYADASAFATAHSGYTLNTANSYIEQTTVTKRKMAGKIFPEVRTLAGPEPGREASEQLAELAWQYMNEHNSTVEHIRLELVQLPAVIRVGDNINVLYRRTAIPGYQYVHSITGVYTITQVTHRVVNGVLVANATASSIQRPPKTADEVLHETVEYLKREAGHPKRMTAQQLSGTRVPEV